MPFVKGQSGNPSGLNSFGRHAIRLAESLRAGPLQEAVDTLVKALASPDAIPAAKEIIARAVGKPAEALPTLADFSDAELMAELDRRFGTHAPTASNVAASEGVGSSGN